MGRGFAEGSKRVARMNMAAADILDRETFHDLASDSDPLVRATVAKRPDISVALMAMLAADGRAPVRANLAANPAIFRAEAALKALLADLDVSVAVGLVENPEAPRWVLEKLVFHRRRAVRIKAQHALDGTEPERAQAPAFPVGARMHGTAFAASGTEG